MSSSIPRHVAVIMDGNGRWAEKRGLHRTAGHKQGAEAARRIVKAAVARGVEYLTLFGFSSENWSRPTSEIDEIMKLLRYYLRAETAELHKSGARLMVIGDRAAFAQDIVEMIENAENLTRENTKITVVIALNYGGRQDIMQAARKAAAAPADQFETAFEKNLMTVEIPDPDLLIRTSGEIRISNFLLWQCAYTEFVFTETLWPDFEAKDFDAALVEYGRRERRYGAVAAPEKKAGG